MAFRMYLVAAFLMVSLPHFASSLSCVQCRTDQLDSDCTRGNVTSKPCEVNDDLCYYIRTRLELSNDGPQDRLRDNESKQSISRGCANKESFTKFVEVDQCYEETLGGGGKQQRCMCSGNDCNSAVSVRAGLSLLVAGLLVKYLL